VFQYYRENVKGNENISRDQASRKLTRNVLLAMEVPPRNFLETWSGNTKYIYGNLHIIVKRGKVIKLFNNHGKVKAYGGWFLDKEKYNQLTKDLKIVD
jgi:hypothetical protein